METINTPTLLDEIVTEISSPVKYTMIEGHVLVPTYDGTAGQTNNKKVPAVRYKGLKKGDQIIIASPYSRQTKETRSQTQGQVIHVVPICILNHAACPQANLFKYVRFDIYTDSPVFEYLGDESEDANDEE